LLTVTPAMPAAPARPTIRTVLRTGTIVALMLVLLGLFAWPLITASPASAATPGVQLSDDGVHFSSTYTGSLFDDTALMVPSTSQTGHFWVKNASGDPAFLRVSISGVNGGGSPFSGALTVSASAPSSSGSAVPVDAALPCYVLTQGLLLAPGAVARVDATLALGNLNGTSGQSSSVDFDIIAGLSSAATGSMPATTCLTNSGTVPGTPGGGGGTGGGGSTGGTTSGGVHGHGGSGSSTTPADPQPSGNASAGYDAPTPTDGSAFAGAGESVAILDPNTGRFFQEWWVMAWVFGVLAGGILCVLYARRRFTHDEEEEVTRWVDVPLSGRKAWSTTSGWA
jgi:hypothetical protein